MPDIVLNNYSDDSRIKQYIQQNLMSRVFHDIPLNVLNTGAFSIINEYISQATEQMAFTSSFYFNESFITKAVLPDSIYAEAAIFNLGYAFATPSCTNLLLELRMSDLMNNAVDNPDTGFKEFILDKDTKFNLPNGNVYSLDYDILFQYKTVETATNHGAAAPAWNIQYTNFEPNCVAVNKNRYIVYRVTDTWLCLFVSVSEYTRTKYTVINSNTQAIPNEDYLIQTDGHICGFDVTYVYTDTDGNEVRKPLSRDHILAIHDDVKDMEPYVHYIMDNPKTIRLMFQLMGTRFFVPKMNSSFEIVVYTSHGQAANFTEAPSVQPSVITATTKYPNNANVTKAAFVISGSLGGTDIGNTETLRRETIEAYNTANVISTDHDIDEWFKTFYFKNILYPFFYKRRDDPWGRIWSGYLALKDDNDNVYRTNTLHGKIPYYMLFNNSDNTITQNEIVIPPGWIWRYGDENTWTVVPYVSKGSTVIETANTLQSINEKFVFTNPFGVKIQKDPFAIAYFNPWVDLVVLPTRVPSVDKISYKDINTEDISRIYHATPIDVEISRTYKDDYYRVQTYVDLSQLTTVHGEAWVKRLLINATSPEINEIIWTYFNRPRDIFATDIPLLPHLKSEGALPFDPTKTYLCVRNKYVRDDGNISLGDVWIRDESVVDNVKEIDLDIANMDYLYGHTDLWGVNGTCEPIAVTGDTRIICYGMESIDVLKFNKSGTADYYTLQLKEDISIDDTEGQNRPIKILSAVITVDTAYKTSRQKFGEAAIWNVGEAYRTVTLNIDLSYSFIEYDDDGEEIDATDGGTLHYVYNIQNAVNVCLPYATNAQPVQTAGVYRFSYPVTSDGSDQGFLSEGTILAYATMKASPSSNTIDYYRIPFSAFSENEAMLYIKSSSVELEKNNLRVVLHAYLNGVETGHVEMLPVQRESDGAYLYQADMYPLNEMLDVDNIIRIASLDVGGGNWTPVRSGKVVTINAIEPELRISILFKSDTNPDRISDIVTGDTFTGYLLNDQYYVRDFSLVQELKEMRSVVDFQESSMPTIAQVDTYNEMSAFYDYNVNGSLYDVYTVAEHQMLYQANMDKTTRAALSVTSNHIKEQLETMITDIKGRENVLTDHDVYLLDKNIQPIYDVLNILIADEYVETFSYQDDNIQIVYAKEFDTRYADAISNYRIYYDFIINHPKSIYDNSDDALIRDRDYVLNLGEDLVNEYPYETYAENPYQFNIVTVIPVYDETTKSYKNINYGRTDVVPNDTTYISTVRDNLKYMLYVIEKIGDVNVDDIPETEKDYSKLYEDEDCTIELAPVENVYYVIKEDDGLDTIFKLVDGTLTKQDNVIVWEDIYGILCSYKDIINTVFETSNVNGGMTVQLMPFVEYSLMKSDKFKDFVKTFTQVHKAIEPVIFKRLEGNHYLDCKLVATYGLPHSYCSDKQYYASDDLFWPDLNIQISFDVKLYNRALASNTKQELRLIVRDYFNRLTTVHTPKQLVTMNNNIYVSHIIQRMESHDNVAYLKFNGWYTNEKNDPNGNYMDAMTQSIVQRWRRLEDMPTNELERYVPEMFVLDEENIEINIIDDEILV